MPGTPTPSVPITPQGHPCSAASACANHQVVDVLPLVPVTGHHLHIHDWDACRTLRCHACPVSGFQLPGKAGHWGGVGTVVKRLGSAPSCPLSGPSVQRSLKPIGLNHTRTARPLSRAGWHVLATVRGQIPATPRRRHPAGHLRLSHCKECTHTVLVQPGQRQRPHRSQLQRTARHLCKRRLRSHQNDSSTGLQSRFVAWHAHVRLSHP